MSARAVILAAGQGTRLGALTADRPKCLVEVAGKSILEFTIKALRKVGVNDVTIAAGYRAELLEERGYQVAINRDFENSNMVASLFAAYPHKPATADLLICYGDCIYSEEVLRRVLAAEAAINVAVDRKWRKLWQLRMDDPLTDAETLKLGPNGQLLEIGKKPRTYADIDAQYMGLIKVRADYVRRLIAHYQAMDRNAKYDGQPFQNMYMTSFVQSLIDNEWEVRAVEVENGWLEVDTPVDISVYDHLHAQEELDEICKLP